MAATLGHARAKRTRSDGDASGESVDNGRAAKRRAGIVRKSDALSGGDHGHEHAGDSGSSRAEAAAAAARLAALEADRVAQRKRFERGAPVQTKSIKDRKSRSMAERSEAKIKKAASEAAAATSLLLTETPGTLEAEGMERTYKFKQAAIRQAVDVQSAAKSFSLELPTGPYTVAYTGAGRHLLIGGRGGHVAMMDWQRGSVTAELQLGEAVRHAVFLHNETMFAVAQKRYVYIYDSGGTELHCMRDMQEPARLEFLPHHFLLCSIGSAGYLKYLDTSTGTMVAQHRTALGTCNVMRASPRNAIVHLGHTNGCVTLWSPNMSTALVRMLCHRGPVHALAMDMAGNTLVTAGLDRQLHVWDTRTYRKLHSYLLPKPAVAIDISQRGMLAAGWANNVTVWGAGATAAAHAGSYMQHHEPGTPIQDVRFAPFEDVLGVGHARGYTSLLIPGSGEPNIDTFAANPYSTLRQRREAEVHALLAKIPAELIALDETTVGTLAVKPQVLAEERAAEEAAAAADAAREWAPKNKQRGRSRALKKYLRKKHNVVSEKTLAVRAEIAANRARLTAAAAATTQARAGASGTAEGGASSARAGDGDGSRSVLDRFRKRAASGADGAGEGPAAEAVRKTIRTTIRQKGAW